MTTSTEPTKAYLPDTILTPDQVAKWLQVSRRTLQRLPIRSITIGHRTVRYLAKDVIGHLEGQAR